MIETAESECLERLLRALEPHLKAAIVENFPAGELGDFDKEYAELGDVALEAALIAWVVVLALSGEKAAVSLTALDEAMLPPGTTDADLLNAADGIMDGALIRAMLRRFRASLPPGKAAPDELVALLEADGTPLVP